MFLFYLISNYRPIANLPFLVKVLERVVGQLQKCISTNNLLELFQSAFKSGHSTETALVWVTNDFLTSADTDACSILVFLDISAAFDTICHTTLKRYVGG